MQPITPMTNRKRILLVTAIVALLSVMFLYQKHGPRTPLSLVMGGEVPGTTAASMPLQDAAPSPRADLVKAAGKSSGSGTYTAEEAKNHLALTEGNVIWFTNYYRTRNGLKALAESGALDGSAAAKGGDMISHQYFDHTRPNSNVGFDHFIDGEHYDFIKVGENIALGDFTTSKEVVDAWMASAPHKKNILDPFYTEIGVSVNTGTYHGAEETFITQHFGDPRSNCPSVSEATKTQIDRLKSLAGDIHTNITTKQHDIGQKPPAEDPGYDQLIKEYNDLVDAYNTIQKQIQALITTYNQQVQSFDRCVTGNRTSS